MSITSLPSSGSPSTALASFLGVRSENSRATGIPVSITRSRVRPQPTNSSIRSCGTKFKSSPLSAKPGLQV